VDSSDLAALVTGLAVQYQVPGAQLAVHHRGRTLTAETGADAAGTGQPVSRDSAFPLGSLTKPFAAALAMTLVADEDVELDEPLLGYLPEFGAGQDVTLRQLLSHTSGLAANVEADAGPAASRRRWVARHCRAEDLVHPPGTVFSYSNVGYVVVGSLVEVITGMDWAEALEAIVLRPLGIVASYVAGSRQPPARPVVGGHVVDAARGRILRIADQYLPAIEMPNGGLALSAADLVTFGRLYLAAPASTGSLHRRIAAEMCRDQLAGIAVGPFGLADGWGLGWARYRDAGTTLVGHDGTGDGTSCHLRIDPGDGSVIALTTNANTGHAMWGSLIRHLRSAGPPVERQGPAAGAGGRRPAWPQECLGRYVNGDAEFIISREDDGELRLSIGDQPYSELTFDTDLRFTMRELAGHPVAHRGRFMRDNNNNRIAFLQISGRLARKC